VGRVGSTIVFNVNSSIVIQSIYIRDEQEQTGRTINNHIGVIDDYDDDDDDENINQILLPIRFDWIGYNSYRST